MSELPDPLDERLDSLFGAVELSAEFEARLLARVRLEAGVRERVERSYRGEVIAATKRRRRLLGFLTLDVAAAGTLLVFAAALASRVLQSAPVAVKSSPVWQSMGLGSLSALLAVIVILAGAAVLWPDFDYGRSPE